MIIPILADSMEAMVTNKHYDAIVVLGCNIAPAEHGFRPTTYQDHDEFGMLAGEMNVIAAVILYESGAADTFVFSTGTSEKTKAAFGPEVPTEAEVYSKDFLARIKNSTRRQPTVIHEDRSVNTYTNLAECLKIMREHGWRHTAIMSARYHIPRVRALWELATKGQSVPAVDFIMSEDIVINALPGIYDNMIDEAYDSPEGKKRLANEAQGVNDMQAGKYVVTEFQLEGQN